jgi:hypothetical protein
VNPDESEGDVFAELERTRRAGKTLFVVEPDSQFPQTKAAQFYRCAETFSQADRRQMRRLRVRADRGRRVLDF